MRRASIINRVTVSNFRCFHELQTARLAPLTLLVGGNSTGKTSFLALIRALWDVAVGEEVPSFQDDPYDLGVFRDIAHHRGARGGRADSFEAGFTYRGPGLSDTDTCFRVTFEERQGVPFPVRRRLEYGDAWVQVSPDPEQGHTLCFGTSKTEWQTSTRLRPVQERRLFPMYRVLDQAMDAQVSNDGAPTPDWPPVETLMDQWLMKHRVALSQTPEQRPFASAPVRSRPRRTYDPTSPSRDPEGDFVPAYLDHLSRRDMNRWLTLKAALESFGRESGLFDEIAVKSLGAVDGAPFQVQIWKYGARGRRKGPPRNLIDVGYGVSQALPVLTELLRADSPSMCLLQQPEVHLHPSAQAALGSLLCRVAAESRQLVVETHSDHLLDRVRMDVHDETTPLKADDVSILFFERGELDVKIHSLRLDDEGNVLDAPPTYRQFFMEEMNRSIRFL